MCPWASVANRPKSDSTRGGPPGSAPFSRAAVVQPALFRRRPAAANDNRMPPRVRIARFAALLTLAALAYAAFLSISSIL